MNAIQGIVETAIYADDLDRPSGSTATSSASRSWERRRAGTFSSRSATASAARLPPGRHAQGRPPPAPRSPGPGPRRLWHRCGRSRPLARPAREHGVAIEHEETWQRGGQVPLFSRSRRKLGRARDPGSLGPAFGLVSATVCTVETFDQGGPVRVLMTGGYGCIGSWVAKQLASGEEVWIYDLKEDTHRLDLVLDPSKGRPSTSCRATSPTPTPCERPSETSGRPISFIWPGCKRPPAGPTRSWVRGST